LAAQFLAGQLEGMIIEDHHELPHFFHVARENFPTRAHLAVARDGDFARLPRALGRRDA
jgi:hypothetical protein